MNCRGSGVCVSSRTNGYVDLRQACGDIAHNSKTLRAVTPSLQTVNHERRDDGCQRENTLNCDFMCVILKVENTPKNVFSERSSPRSRILLPLA